jgi:DnaK suppressor protein
MNAEQLDRYKQQLLDLRESIVGQVNSAQQQSFETFSTMDVVDPVDMAVMDREQTVLLSIGESERDLLAMIDEALQRISLGSYGSCQNCGQEIPAARLEAVPYARYCINCQDKLERGLLDEE